MKYSKHSLKQYNKKKLTSDWAYQEVVFVTPQGKYIVRVRKNNHYETISQHKTEKEANKVYGDFNSKPKSQQ